MRKPIQYGALCLVALSIACSKLEESPDPILKGDPIDTNDPYLTNYSSLEEVFADISDAPLKFSADIAQPITYTTGNNTFFSFPANSLVDMAGNPVTGSVDFSITEFVDFDQMVIHKTNTLTNNNEILESGGMFDIKISKNGSPLRMAEGQNYAVTFPTTDTRMSLFIGDKTSSGEMNWKERLDWVLETDSSRNFLTFLPDSLTYINCDRRINVADPVNFSMKLSAEQKDMSFQVYMYFKSTNTLLSVYQKNGEYGSVASQIQYPNNEDVLIVVCAIKDHYLYWYDMEYTLGSGPIQLPVIEKVSKSQFEARMKAIQR